MLSRVKFTTLQTIFYILCKGTSSCNDCNYMMFCACYRQPYQLISEKEFLSKLIVGPELEGILVNFEITKEELWEYALFIRATCLGKTCIYCSNCILGKLSENSFSEAMLESVWSSYSKGLLYRKTSYNLGEDLQ